MMILLFGLTINLQVVRVYIFVSASAEKFINRWITPWVFISDWLWMAVPWQPSSNRKLLY